MSVVVGPVSHCCSCSGCGALVPNTWTPPGEAITVDGRFVYCSAKCYESDPTPFALSRPASVKVLPERFHNNTLADGSPRAQRVLFAGSHSCLPGQGDLFA